MSGDPSLRQATTAAAQAIQDNKKGGVGLYAGYMLVSDDSERSDSWAFAARGEHMAVMASASMAFWASMAS